MRKVSSRHLAATAVTGLTIAASLFAGTPAAAGPRDFDGPRVSHHEGTVSGPRGTVHHGGTTIRTDNRTVHVGHTSVDRNRAGWWHGQPGFTGYHGVRHGYYYAPGHGYYAVPRVYPRSYWVVGGVLPVSARRYVVVSPAYYGLRPAPVGYRWYYSGSNLVLVTIATGVIVQSVAGGW